MHKLQGKAKRLFIGCLLMVLAMVVLGSVSAQARLIIRSELISTRLVEVGQDGSLLTANGDVFYPLHEAVELIVQENTMITIRYLERDGRKVFVEAAPGAGALQPVEYQPMNRGIGW